MSEDSGLLLNQYFSEDSGKSPVKDEISEASVRMGSLNIDEEDKSSNKMEPEVCRIFSATMAQPKDPTAAFFDLIGAQATYAGGTSALSELRVPSQPSTDDGFGARVITGLESERRRDAWIPSERTKQCLALCSSSPPGSYFAERDMLTMPGVILEEELGDVVGEAVSVCLGEAEAAQRRILSAGDVTQDERGLRELIQAGAYRPAINLTARLLTIYGQGRGRTGHPSKHSPNSLQLWFTRIALLVKIKSYALAQAEADAFGQLDKPDLFFKFYPDMYGNRPGSMASFSFRLLLAELPSYCGKPKESLTKLFSILAIVRQIITNLNDGLTEEGAETELTETDRSDSLRLWLGREARVIHSIVNCALTLKDYELAMTLVGDLCKRDGAPKDTLLSALGRLHLQLGDVAGAEVCFAEAREFRGGPPDVREFVDRGLVAVAQNAFDDAYCYFQEASLLEPSNIMILNNMGVCLLYGGHLKEAIAVLETAVASNPAYGLNESLLLNLCTLYDMESSKGRMKKFALLRQISRYQADAPTAILEKLYG